MGTQVFRDHLELSVTLNYSLLPKKRVATRLSNKKTWDRVIYGLIYPGFLGSMLSRAHTPNSADFSAEYFLLRSDNHIRYLILAFYFLDFIHLFDMHDAMKDVEERLRY